MAPSSLKSTPATMGIYTARDIRKGDLILAAPDGPSITLFTDRFRAYSPRFPSKRWTSLWGEYAWGRGRGVPDHIHYEASSIMEFQITTGALPNHHCLLHSLSYRFPDPAYDDSLVDHGASPGTGAFSYNRGRDAFVNRDVKAGEELFLNYGRCRHDTHPAWAEGLPMPVDFRAAVAFMAEVYTNTSNSQIDAEHYKIRPPAAMDVLAAGILPKTLRELRDTMDKNFTTPELIRTLARKTGINQRTPKWLRENGRCLEHLVPGMSQLANAGHGGIAQHFIAEGDIVVPAPVIHLMDRHVLEMNDENGRKVGDQLLLNYCFGHRDSTLLLCPNTNAILINHCSHRSNQNCAPNAVVRWSNGWDATSDAWRKMSLHDLAQQPFRGLDMEIVALRDIAPGEEVFLDYGLDWENAWNAHVRNWKPSEPVLSAKEANEFDFPPDFLLVEDLRDDAQHPHLFAGCRYWETEEDEEKMWRQKDPDWKSRSDHEILKTYAKDGSIFVGDYSEKHDKKYWPCLIYSPKTTQERKSGLFTVRILQQHFGSDHTNWDINHLPRILTSYPRKSIHFFVRRGESDQTKPGVFRHFIGMPDDAFPQHWKNLAA